MKRRILSLALCGCLVAGMLPAMALADNSQNTATVPVVTAEETATSGTCGENLFWNYDEATTTLTISGEGAMDDYGLYTWDDLPPAPWNDLPFTKVIVEEGVTYIGTDALGNCVAMTDVYIPESVTAVGDGSIRRSDYGLFSIHYAGNMAQWFALNPAHFAALAGNVIYGDDTIVLPNQCGENLTWNYDEATKTLTISGEGAMWNYIADQETDENQPFLPPWANTGYVNLVVEEGVTYIGDAAFSGSISQSNSLTNISLPSSLTGFGAQSFYNFGQPATVRYAGNLVEWFDMDPIDAFTDYTGVTLICADKSADDHCGKDITWSYDASTKTLTISGTGDMWDYVDGLATSYRSPWSNLDIEKVSIANGVTHIGSYAFTYNDLHSIIVPHSVTSIGWMVTDWSSLDTIYYTGTQQQWEILTTDVLYGLENVEIIYNYVPEDPSPEPTPTPTPTPEPTQKPEPTPTPTPEVPTQENKVEVTVTGDKAETTVGSVDIVLGNAGKVFEAGTTVTVEKITQGTIYDTVKKALDKVVAKMDTAAIFEFTATLDGKTVQPNGGLSVTFDIPANLSTSNLKLFYVSQDGKYEEVPITVNPSAKTVTATLTHFSTYVLANAAPVSGGNVPQTGDTSALTLYVCVLAIAMAGLTILLVNKRKA